MMVKEEKPGHDAYDKIPNFVKTRFFVEVKTRGRGFQSDSMV
jgi:hypothetical protein